MKGAPKGNQNRAMESGHADAKVSIRIPEAMKQKWMDSRPVVKGKQVSLTTFIVEGVEAQIEKNARAQCCNAYCVARLEGRQKSK